MNRRTYCRKDAIVFRKTREEFGGLSNMATGFPLKINGIRIFTSEALYQSCRFPHLPELQRIIVGQRSPMTAKMKGKPHQGETRADWDRVKVKIMRWCLRVKLAQNWTEFSQLLLETGDRPIVEESRRDDFWGAKVIDEQTLRGSNVLGRLLMELRKRIRQSNQESLSIVEPVAIPDFLLDGRTIGTIFGHADKVIYARDSLQAKTRAPVSAYERSDASSMLRPVQGLLFGSPNRVESERIPALGKSNELKPYPVYRDSGVPWLGKIPEDWKVMPNRAVFEEIREKGHPDEEMLSVTIAQGVIKQTSLLSDTSKKDSSNEDKSKYKLVCPGDIAYNKMRAWQGAIGASGYRGIVSPAYIVIRPRENQNPRYLHYLFRTPAFAKEAERWSYGISSDQWSLRAEEFKQIYSCVPPLPEQGAIVCYLDYMDRWVRRYINGKRKLISRLNEQKQVIIHEAVTRGLDPNVRLKSSGVKWLADIPEHWEVRRLRYVIRGKLTYGANVAGEYSNTDWPRYLRISDFALDGTIRKETFCSLPPEIARDYLLNPGDILLARSGATVGKAFLVGPEVGEACHAGYLIRARPDPNIIEPEFLYSYIQSPAFERWKESTFIIATIQNIAADKYANLYIPIPSLPEQKRILDCIHSETASIIGAITRAERGIKLVREYRTRLIADVITGKLDVREASANLPEDVEQPEDIQELTDTGGTPEEVALEPAIAEATDDD